MRRLIWFWQAASIGEPLTPVICHSVVTAAGSPLSLSSLSLSLFWGDSNSHKQNQTTVPTNSLSLLLVLSLSLSLSLSVLYFSFFLSEVILKATEQRLPVHKHWVPAQALLLSLCVTKDCQESKVTVCYKSQNKSQSQRIPHHQNRLNDSQRSQ